MASESMDVLELLHKWGMDGDVDFLREALGVLVEGIMDAEVSAKAGNGYGERSADRVTQRNGYHNRSWDTRVGTSEDGAFWLSFLRSLVARGLAGVELVISDAQQGLRDAIGAKHSVRRSVLAALPHALHD